LILFVGWLIWKRDLLGRAPEAPPQPLTA
jgi:hypothetical protein